MIEAVACRAPVIAFRRGAVAEVIDHGVTGFIVDAAAGAVGAVKRLETLDRARVRAVFEERFTAERMAHDYPAIYRSLPGVRRDAAQLCREHGRIDLQAVA